MRFASSTSDRAGITGHGPLLAAIPVRDVRGMKWRPAVACISTGNKWSEVAGVPDTIDSEWIRKRRIPLNQAP
jgi:hypothetical protein